MPQVFPVKRATVAGKSNRTFAASFGLFICVAFAFTFIPLSGVFSPNSWLVALCLPMAMAV